MPVYEFMCDQCKKSQDQLLTYREVQKVRVLCPHCHGLMRRVFKVGGIILKGSGWPGKALKRRSEDGDIQRQRRKAAVLKDKGEVPRKAVIGLEEADKLYDKRHTEGELDKLYEGTVTEGE